MAFPGNLERRMMESRSRTGIAALEAELVRLGVPVEGLDLAWLAQVRDETERTIAELRQDERFAAALPATAAWPELQWKGSPA